MRIWISLPTTPLAVLTDPLIVVNGDVMLPPSVVSVTVAREPFSMSSPVPERA